MTRLIMLCLPVLLLAGCTYSYKPKAESEVPAYVTLRGTLLGKPAQDPKNYSLDITGINGATFSMIPPSLNSDRPQEMPISPGPNKAKIYVNFPNGADHIDMPFVAKPGAHYSVTYDINKDGKHAIMMRDKKGNLAQGVTFNVITRTTYVPITVRY